MKTLNLNDKEKLEQDMLFLQHILFKARPLTAYSVFLWWFPPEMQQVIELLMALNKPLKHDMGGLLGAIMFAGLAADKTDFAMTQIVEKMYIQKKENLLNESQQNLSTLLFGITLDDVRKLC